MFLVGFFFFFNACELPVEQDVCLLLPLFLKENKVDLQDVAK